MAAPPEKTLEDLSGSWVMNKKLSGDTDAVLSLQGVSWFLRKTIGLATVTLNHKHYKDADGVEHIDIDQVITPGLQGTRELRTINWTWRDHKDIVFGAVKGRTRKTRLADVADDEDGRWMKEGWDEATLEKGECIETYVESQDKGWTANQFWGFETVDGERRYVRHVVVKDKSGKKVLRLKIIYDWAGPLPEAPATA
ncbi:putative lccl domain-containing protein [Neofusicoccum parvum UCRNP2]|uniref:Putative lccl domain-containing protein n=1 Tax=Botryosphaeria parva (strain UCR-NP2) TaxID=1287680 RepID=R1EVS1_BOTPV|nr:putative lccl domain-containing protein [Neofusicoccum parvum UCRNP2]